MTQNKAVELAMDNLQINPALTDNQTSYGTGQSSNSGITPFGKQFGDKYFVFDKQVVNVNHGSYGAVPEPVVKAKFEYLKKAYGHPENHFKLSIENKVKEIREKVAEVVDTDAENLVLVTNDTTAVNTVLRNYPFKKGDTVIYCNTSFINCSNALKFLKDTVGIELVEVQLLYPMSNQDVIDAYTQAMDSNANVKMALFDTVSSVPAALLPWEELCHECRKRGVLSIVDGAHGIGLIPISLRSARPDFFTSNLHKWFFTPVSLALLYVDKDHHGDINPLNIPAKHLTKDDLKAGKRPLTFSEKFLETGTIDFSNIQSVEDAIKFRNEICGGEDSIRQYCFNLAIEAGEYMANEFGTEILSGKQDTISTSMITIRVPFDAPSDKASQVFSEFTSYICNKWNTFVPIFFFNEAWWIRLSAQIYLDIDDFKYSTKAILDTLQYVKSNL